MILRENCMKKRLEKKREDEEKQNWENTMRLIRNEVRVEHDSEMARIIREKEELERRLSQRDNNLMGGIEYPEYWNFNHTSYDQYQIFNVTRNSTEWYKVAGPFQGTLNINISRIERVQNNSLWQFYSLKKQVMDNSHGSNERYLFHGSKTNAYDLIIKDGFDHRVSNMNGALGAGIYFASDASTSQTYVTRNGNQRRMLYCRVLIGVSGQGSNGIRRPPNKPGTNEIYDSVTRNNTIYAIFDNHQAYPEYIIYFH